MPTINANDEEVEEVYAGIEELIKLTKGEDNLIIMDDWNAVVEEGVDGQLVSHYGLGVRNDRGERLVDFCKKYNMSIANTFQNIHRR